MLSTNVLPCPRLFSINHFLLLLVYRDKYIAAVLLSSPFPIAANFLRSESLGRTLPESVAAALLTLWAWLVRLR